MGAASSGEPSASNPIAGPARETAGPQGPVVADAGIATACRGDALALRRARRIAAGKPAMGSSTEESAASDSSSSRDKKKHKKKRKKKVDKKTQKRHKFKKDKLAEAERAKEEAERAKELKKEAKEKKRKRV